MDSTTSEASSALNKWGRALAILIALAAALALLGHELRHYHYAQVALALRHIDPRHIRGAIALTVLAYAILPLYDALAIVYAGQRLDLSRIAFSSSIAYGLSQTLGFPIVTSSAVRYRFWSAWGLTSEAIARAVSFVGATFTLGIVALSGLALVLEPDTTLAVIPFPDWLSRAIGVLLLLSVAAYLAWSMTRRAPMRIRGWEFPVPTPPLALAQVIIATADWIAAGAVLYLLLPDSAEITFLSFLGIFALAQFAGFVSHVPGGLGVFETVMLVLLKPHLAPDQTFAVLLAYRAIYYLLPFFAALIALGLYELRATSPAIAVAATSTAGFVRRWVPAIL